MDTNDFRPPEPTGTDGDTREQIAAISHLIYAFIQPLLALIPSRYKADIQEALDKMKEVINDSVNS